MGTPDQGPWTGASSHQQAGQQRPAGQHGTHAPQPGPSAPVPQHGPHATAPAPGPYAPSPLGTSAEPPARTGLGLLLLAPAAIALLLGQIIPTVRLFISSLQERALLGGGVFVGLDNYGQIPPELLTGLLVGAAAGLAPALLGFGVGMLIGRLLAKASARAAAIGLGILGAGLVTMAPFSYGFGVGPLARGDGAGIVLGFLAVGLGAALLVGALVGRLVDGPGRGRATALALVGTGLAGIAVGWQTFTPYIVGGDRELPGALIYESAFLYADAGVAGAIAIVVLIPLVLFGLLGTALVVGTRYRIEPPPVPRTDGAAGIVGVVLAAVALVGLILVALPWLTSLGLPEEELGISAAGVFVTTWGSALGNALVGTAIAAAGGYAIGYLRPFGPRSERVLWFFAPWLFVGLGALAPAYFLILRDLNWLNRPTLEPPFLTIGALFLFTFLFAAVRRSPDRRSAPRVAGLTVLGVFAIETWLGPQGALWPYLSSFSPDSQHAVLVLTQLFSRRFETGSVLGLLTPVPLVVLFAAAFALLTSQLARVRIVSADAGSTGWPGPYAAQPGQYVAQPGPYAGQPGPYAGQPGPYAGQPGPYAGQPGPYAGQPGPYAGQPGSYGAQLGQYGAPPDPAVRNPGQQPPAGPTPGGPSAPTH
ncbi:hypothetical protein [Occultella gossypii]|uniref:Uncharacterized protein n=1 Tax=Occultella gossypii TaxID=2800820 RepID=A0ABS7S8J1_9MICO|nr:hypothetical protein [Occultella gossypii]MBZ2196666.1 hypothetical protein [Occultella gossypii]